MKTLTPVEFNDQRILTTEQLAEVYGTEANNIKNNFNNHQDQFIEGKHYYLLQGEDLRAFKNQVNDIDLVSKHTAASGLNAELPGIARFWTLKKPGSSLTIWKIHISA